MIYETTLASKVGIKKKLTNSAIYPREFGNAIAALLPIPGARPTGEPDASSFHSYPSSDSDWGALDDLLKGSDKAWWRKHTSSK